MVKELEVIRYGDDRGYFFESWNKDSLEKQGIYVDFVQSNISKSCIMTIRGMHMQTGIHSQAKLIQVIKGGIIDFVVCVDPKNEEFGVVKKFIITDKNRKALFIPKNYLHGFIALDDDTLVTYMCDEFWHRESEISINPLSIREIQSTFDITGKIARKHSEIIISEKDAKGLDFYEFLDNVKKNGLI